MESGFTPLFTGGSGRSGTTILINLLKNHPQVHASLPREIKYLTSRFATLRIRFKYRKLRNEINNPTNSDFPDEGELPKGKFRF